MRVAIVHDYLTQHGGAERVVLALHRMFPDAPIYTSLYDPEGTFEQFRDTDVRTSFIQRLPHRGGLFRLYLPLYATAFDGLRLRGYDLVISSSSGWAHAVRAPDAHHVCYCHSPAKWLYQAQAYLGSRSSVDRWLRVAIAPALGALGRWDRRVATRPDAYIANSTTVARRILEIYGREAQVVHPPVDVERFSRTESRAQDEGFYLVVARLLPYKRVDLAVRVCTRRHVPLVVVGEGPAYDHLQRIAGPTVTMAGRISESELVQRYRACRALIQCGAEDFGLAPLEANAAGRPVVAYARGGATDTVVEGRTGILFAEQSEGALHDALDRLEARPWDRDQLRRHASRFDESRFATRMRSLIARLGADRRVETP
ncbi:MAG: glycosyltransferase [Actinomycetota bacterium]